MATVLLPCDVEEWWEDKKLFVLLSRIRNLKEFDLLIKSYTRQDQPQSVISRRLKALSGLSKFLVNFCSDEEQKTFMSVTLPFIAKTASILDERVPDCGIPFLERQECTALVLGRKLILSLLSAAFLCCFPAVSPHNINFTELFAVFNQQNNEAQQKNRAEKLKCILCYFQRAAEAKCNLSGVITLKRQVIPVSDLPTMADWLTNKFPLSPLLVDDQNSVENSGSHTLQVNFGRKSVGGEVLAGGFGTEEIRFSISPELFISRLIMDDLEDNEAVIISGVERFANYDGCDSTFQFGGEFSDNTERDVFGNLLNSIVSIDASLFAHNPQHQYETGSVLRELNKAYVGFLCQQDRGDLSTELLALGVKRGSLAFVEESYSDVEYNGGLTFSSKYGALGNVNISSSSLAPRITVGPVPVPVEPTEVLVGSVPLSPIQEVAESSQVFDLASNIVQSGIKKATAESAENDLAANILKSGIKQATVQATAKSAENDLAANILKSGIKQATAETAESDLAANILKSGIQQATAAKIQQNGDQSAVEAATVDSFASKLATSLFDGAVTKATATVIQPAPQVVTQDKRAASDDNAVLPTTSAIDDVASALSSSILKTSLRAKPSSSITSDDFQAVSDKMAESIISDVLSHDHSHPTPLSVTTQTSGQTTSDSRGDVSNIVESLADNISRDILSGVVNQSGAAPSSINRPAIYIQVERRGSAESGRSSRSSSITGQTITLHEFTDDLVESALQDGIAIAQLTAQSRDFSPEPPPATEEHRYSPKPDHRHDNTDSFKVNIGEFADIMTSQLIQDSLDQVKQDNTVPTPSLATNTSSPPKSFKQPPSLVRQGLTISSSVSSQQKRLINNEHQQDPDPEPVSNLLTTPSSSRMSYAWSTASTRDEDSRPVSPTELDRIALGLTFDPEEYTSLLSKVVVSDAIVMVTGEHSPRRQGVKEEGIAMTNTASCNPSWIDTFLSGLGEAETPAPDAENLMASNWHKMRRFLLRPVATGNWGCGVLMGGDTQLKCMLQWAAVSASGRPQTVYYTSKNEALNQLPELAQQLRTKQWTVGQLCQALVDYSSQAASKDKNLFSTLLEKL